MDNGFVRRYSVYQRDGECCGQSLDLEGPAPTWTRGTPTIAGLIPLRQIMSADVVCGLPDLSISAVVSLMVKNHIGCLPVVDDRRRPLGMITKFDIVEQLDTYMRSPNKGGAIPADLVADEVMMPIALTLQETATVAQAAAMMTSEDLHHVIVVNATGHLVGVVSTKDITNWLVNNDAT